MSYSFSAKGSSKADLLADATRQLDAVIQQQPVHARDREQALANVRNHLDLLPDPAPDEDVVVSMNGSIAVQNFGATAGPERVLHASSGCSVYLNKRSA